MATAIPPGFVGNLTADQEKKLKELWLALAKISGIEIPNGNPNFQPQVVSMPGTPRRSTDSAPLDDRASMHTVDSVTKKKRRFGLLGRKDEGGAGAASSGAPAVEDKYGQGKEFTRALAEMTPAQLRRTFWTFSKGDNPDGLLLRFLRARKWNVQNALIMMVSTVRWRMRDVQLDDQLVPVGEAGMLEAAEGRAGSENPFSQALGRDFMKQLRMGKSFVHGQDKEGRPICYVRVRLHRGSDQSVEAIEKFTVFTIETARIMLRAPVETAAVIFDMTGFSMANMDYTPLKFMIKCFEANYPESLGRIFIYRAPWIFNSLWNVIKGWLDPVVAAKVSFIKDAKELSAFIDMDRIPTELGGAEDWAYSYTEPAPGENALLKDTATRDRLWAARWALVERYEQATQDWIFGDGPASAAAAATRAAIAADLKVNYWQMDPYTRARTLYDRLRVIRGHGVVEMYPDEVPEDLPLETHHVPANTFLAEKVEGLALGADDDDGDDVFHDAVEWQVAVAA